MKFVLLICLLVTSKGCDQTDIETINYSEATRGSYYAITATQDLLTVARGRDKASTTEVKMNASDWAELTSMISELKMDQIAKMEAPSTRHQSDGAAISNVAITTSEKEITSPSFDDNNPPQALKPLIDILKKLAAEVD